jgi:hypothetical protein
MRNFGRLDPVEPSAFPFRDRRRTCDRVANHVRRRAAHVEEMIDAEDQQQASLGNVEEAERGGDDDEAGARNAGDTLAR